MSKRIVGLAFTAIILALVLLSNGNAYLPARPTSVPNEATWVGGEDGGAWVLCANADGTSSGEYECKVYAEMGALWKSGKVTLQDYHWDPKEKKAIFTTPKHIPESLHYYGFDGQQIFLENSQTLKFERRK